MIRIKGHAYASCYICFEVFDVMDEMGLYITPSNEVKIVHSECLDNV